MVNDLFQKNIHMDDIINNLSKYRLHPEIVEYLQDNYLPQTSSSDEAYADE